MARVLVAEDDREMRRLVVETLQRHGHEVLVATDGGRLLVWLADLFDDDSSAPSIDLIVSDVRMPVCSGLDLVEKLFEAHWQVPCILMTAFGDDEVRRRAELVGALLMDKPLSMDALTQAVARTLARPALRR